MLLDPRTVTFTLPDFPTELLIRILSYLPAVDLCAVQRTCRRIHSIVTDSSYLQYILLAQINGVDDLLPPNCPFSERIELLRNHEKSWNNLQLNASHEFPSTMNHLYHLQDGYLVYNLRHVASTPQYGYVDLRSADPNEELRWVHISVEHIPTPVWIESAVDHNLVVVLSFRTQPIKSGTLVELTFLEFTTGAPHPLSAKPNVQLPSNTILDVAYAAADVLGDYVLTTVMSGRDLCCFYLVSWKSGAVTFLREIELPNRLMPPWAPRVVIMDNSFIMLVNCWMTYLEICKLELASPDPRLQTVCFLELPALELYAFAVVSTVSKEWIPTSEHDAQSQLTRKRIAPFRSSRVGTIGLLLEYEPCTPSVRERPGCWMTVSVASLLSAIHPGTSDVPTIPWAAWGPAATRISLYRWGSILPRPAGPFWIIDVSPLVVRDYDPLRTRRARSMAEDRSPSPSRPPVFSSTKVLGQHWVAGEVETRLPFRDVVEKNVRLERYIGFVADREWIIEISARGDGTTNVVVYHVG
ncbi:hypothetical protein BJV78DRAFT_1208546 [Lactifluus subvellereus]|nr:hypothetical protein BJV78DRAFT_1208546 [Lactifluus subvellereus]